jgi:hypothetical protein
MNPMRFKFLFHGTSSIYRDSIGANGLLPNNGDLHLATYPCVALLEADRRINGDERQLLGGYKKPVGGFRLIVKVRRSEAVCLRLDSDYYKKEVATGQRFVTLRTAFSTGTPIGPENLSFIDANFEAEFKTLLIDIHRMAKLLPFQYPPDIERMVLAERQDSDTPLTLRDLRSTINSMNISEISEGIDSRPGGINFGVQED